MFEDEFAARVKRLSVSQLSALVALMAEAGLLPTPKGQATFYAYPVEPDETP